MSCFDFSQYNCWKTYPEPWNSYLLGFLLLDWSVVGSDCSAEISLPNYAPVGTDACKWNIKGQQYWCSYICARCVPILEQGYASIIFFLINRSRTRQISFDACHPRSKQFPAPAFDSIAIEQGTPNKHYWTEQYLFKHEKRQMNCLSPSVKRRATTMEVALCQNIYNPAIFLNRNNYLLKIFTKFTKYLQ